MEDPSTTRPSWATATASGMLAVAGVMHLVLADDHLLMARGAGLFFIAMGIVQLAAAALLLRHPEPRVALASLAIASIVPTVLYVITRIWDAPWHYAPEEVDTLGAATVVAQLLAGMALVAFLAPIVPGKRAAQAAGIGLILGVAAYGGGIAVEENEWLATAELPHVHSGGGHGMFEIGVRDKVIVGSVAYDGPRGAQQMIQTCSNWYPRENECYVALMKDLMLAEGAVAAYGALADVVAADDDANRVSHAMAHELGFYAYQVYGYDLDVTLRNCSFEVFQGCLHGALQLSFMDRAAQGLPVNDRVVREACPSEWEGFEAYACFHGLGHGLTLFSEYNRDRSLDLCDALDGSFARTSCYGGVFMENVVAYIASLQPDAGHAHNVGSTEELYWVDEGDPAYPCNAVKGRYQGQCWLMQTSLILFLNGGDFHATTAVCEEAGDMRDTCFKSLGRDAAPYTNRDPQRMQQLCGYSDNVALWYCVEGFAAETVLNYESGEAGLELCAKLRSENQEPCYAEVSRQTSNMKAGDEMTQFCNQVPDPYAEYCHALVR